ncbi:MAG: DnaJ domain-containing protein [Candidatus Limnocylindria bacterium]
MSTDFDAYRALQIRHDADDIVVEAAFRVLARRYHPDAPSGDAARMAEINRAYDLLRTPIRRRRYDRERHTPVGPGRTSFRSSASSSDSSLVSPSVPSPPTNGSAPYAEVKSNGQQPPSSVIDFGRYQGWTLKDLSKHDPDYLRWLARSSGGVRYRNQIHQLLPAEEPEPDLAKLKTRHRG